MLKPGVNPATDLEPLRQHLSAVSRAFEIGCSNCLRGMTQADIDRYLDQKLVFYPAGAGVSDLQKDYRRLLGILGLLVALVLLIACVNVANVMTAQAAARAHEMALRISIGAGRRRLVQLILAQSALLALMASVLGAFFAAWSAPFVLSLVNPPDNPARLALPADWRVLLFGFGLIIFVVLLLGLLPALRASAVRPVAALKLASGEPDAWQKSITICNFVERERIATQESASLEPSLVAWRLRANALIEPGRRGTL